MSRFDFEWRGCNMFGWGADESNGRLRADLRRIEAKLDLLIAHLGLELDPSQLSGLPPEVYELAIQGRKIEAIKRHRALTGSSLAEAKDAVDNVTG